MAAAGSRYKVGHWVEFMGAVSVGEGGRPEMTNPADCTLAVCEDGLIVAVWPQANGAFDYRVALLRPCGGEDWPIVTLSEGEISGLHPIYDTFYRSRLVSCREGPR